MQRLSAATTALAITVSLAACSGGDDTTAEGGSPVSATGVTADSMVTATMTEAPTTSTTVAASTTTVADPDAGEAAMTTTTTAATPEDPVAALVALWRTYPLDADNGMCTLYPHMDVDQVHGWLSSSVAGSRDVTLAIEPAEIAPLARLVTTEEFDDSLRQVCG
ncbi:MAG: hypothetical protein S0880_29520 [Actinomycetota bacterium]|nr:hypothetical protein [Actinomycetota bacterium]